MTPRENILCTLRRKQPEYVPFQFDLCPSLMKEFHQRTGAQNVEAYYDFDMRTFGLNPTRHHNDYSAYFGKLKPGTTINEWGVGHEPGSVEHFTKFLHPMETFETPEEVWNFPAPDILAPYRWEGMKERMAACKAAGYAARFSAIQIFEPAWYLRGLDNLLCDMLTDEEMAHACLERMARFEIETARRAAQCGADIILFGDDVGTQKDMMMDPELYRKWLKPDMARAIAAAKEENPDVIAVYHSDGVIDAIIPDLIEIGMDVLNPVQPECVNPKALKEQYGDKIAFWGCIGTQTTMPFGSVEEVEETVRRMIEDVGKDGGLVLAPTHLLEPEVPYDNIEAFVRAVRRYGKY